MTFAKNNRFAIALFAGLALLSLCSWAYLRDPDRMPKNSPATVAPQDEATATLNSQSLFSTTTDPADTGNLSDTTSTDEKVPANAKTPEATQTEHPTAEYFSLYVGDKKYAPVWRENTSLYDLMRDMTADSRAPFLFSAKEYSGMGYFVEEINGVKNNPQTGEYWIYYVNGQSATVGTSQYIVKKDDVITWKYEKI